MTDAMERAVEAFHMARESAQLENTLGNAAVDPTTVAIQAAMVELLPKNPALTGILVNKPGDTRVYLPSDFKTSWQDCIAALKRNAGIE